MENNVRDVIIIGSGPAGYTAAIYAARANMNPLILTGMEPGGQLTTTTEVENFPGYPEAVTGPEMMADLQKQAERFGTEIKYEYVTEITFGEKEGDVHTLKSNTAEYQAKSIIICTGATAKYLGLDDEKKYAGSGVSACATCDGFFYRGKDVAVVGGGDTAAEEATYLSKLCNKVYLLVRKDEMKASKAMQHRVEHTPNLEVLYNHELLGLEGNNVVEKAKIINNLTNVESELIVDGVFIAIGHKPNTDLFKGKLDMDETGYLITQNRAYNTNIPGVFAAGDVQDSVYRQAITAAGSGCSAALDAERYVAEFLKKFKNNFYLYKKQYIFIIVLLFWFIYIFQNWLISVKLLLISNKHFSPTYTNCCTSNNYSQYALFRLLLNFAVHHLFFLQEYQPTIRLLLHAFLWLK